MTTADPRLDRDYEAATASLLGRLRSAALLPVVELPSAALARPLAEALVDAGLTCVEVTFRTDAAAAALECLRTDFPELLLAAGTVRTAAQLDAATGSGADLIVSPGSNAAPRRLPDATCPRSAGRGHGD